MRIQYGQLNISNFTDLVQNEYLTVSGVEVQTFFDDCESINDTAIC